MNEPKVVLQPLTAFRFLAALAVFCTHHDYCVAAYPQLSDFWQRYLQEGFAGVTFFFILSGFILTYNYHSLLTPLRWGAVRSFYAARLARIFPVHLLSVLLVLNFSISALLRKPPSDLRRLIAELTLTKSFFPDMKVYFSWNGPSWSLSDECFFYALMPVLLALLAVLGWRRPFRAFLLGAGLVLASFAFTWCWQEQENVHWLLYISPLYRLLDFTVGVSLGLVFVRLPRQTWDGLGKVEASVMEVFVLAMLGMAVVYSSCIPMPLRLGAYYTPFCAAIIFVFAFQRGWFSWLLSKWPFLVLGEISFSFYMLHQVIPWNPTYQRLCLAIGVDPCPSLAFLATNFCCTLLASFLCFYCYERPMRRLVRWLLEARKQQPGAQASDGLRTGGNEGRAGPDRWNPTRQRPRKRTRKHSTLAATCTTAESAAHGKLDLNVH
jgi:peptidoglycan/LPS O-acetylase OafA/YrhL